MTPAATALQAPPDNLVDARVAKQGGSRRNAKANYDFAGMMDAASWRRTEVRKHTSWYGCSLCGQRFAGPHAVYTHLAKIHDRRPARASALRGRRSGGRRVGPAHPR